MASLRICSRFASSSKTLYCDYSPCLYYRMLSSRSESSSSSTPTPKVNPEVKPEAEVKPHANVKSYAVKKYVNYMEKIGDNLEKKYPRVYKLYRLVKEGMRDFFADTKMYVQVESGLWAGRSLNSFSRLELESYRQIPSDMLKVAPVLLVAALPFGSNVSFPIAYFFPRHLLCRHFWHPEQRLEFGLFYLNRRLHHFPHILKYLHKHYSDIQDVAKRTLFHSILKKLDSGSHPTVQEIISVKDLFTTRPFGLDHLSRIHRIHMWHVAKSLSFSTRKSKLIESGLLLHYTDLAILREDIKSLSLEDLQQTCFSRGLNAVGADRAELEDFLHQWTSLSQVVDETSISLLLHAPVLLAYNRIGNKKHLLETALSEDQL